MTNVIPLFPQRELPRNQARTHFLLETVGCSNETYDEPDEDDDSIPTLTTLCGREGESILMKDSAQPECEACIEEWARMTGWEFPLPTVVCTG
jgi:hypothetical protein